MSAVSPSGSCRSRTRICLLMRTASCAAQSRRHTLNTVVDHVLRRSLARRLRGVDGRPDPGRHGGRLRAFQVDHASGWTLPVHCIVPGNHDVRSLMQAALSTDPWIPTARPSNPATGSSSVSTAATKDDAWRRCQRRRIDQAQRCTVGHLGIQCDRVSASPAAADEQPLAGYGGTKKCVGAFSMRSAVTKSSVPLYSATFIRHSTKCMGLSGSSARPRPAHNSSRMPTISNWTTCLLPTGALRWDRTDRFDTELIWMEADE